MGDSGEATQTPNITTEPFPLKLESVSYRQGAQKDNAIKFVFILNSRADLSDSMFEAISWLVDYHF